MKMSMNNALYALSFGLDAVENELVGATTNHGKRVAYISERLGHDAGMNEQERMDLACCAVLHDCALTEYIRTELRDGRNPKSKDGIALLGDHCVNGEKNVSILPFYDRAPRGSIQYHHENFNGSGPFGKKGDEIPLWASIIHLADIMDLSLNRGELQGGKYAQARDFVARQSGIMFNPDVAALFLDHFSEARLASVQGAAIDQLLYEDLPGQVKEYSNQEMARFAMMFGRIVDYKSKFTHLHSEGVALKTREMALYFKLDDQKVSDLYVAAALHDVGKMLISRDILEKPGKLTIPEYDKMKLHALYSYQMLTRIGGLEEITPWAALHHEHLDGTSYPFGKTAAELGFEERLVACMDVYQALREERPYHKGKTHAQTMPIMKSMVKSGQLDGDIVSAIDKRYAYADTVAS